jgi:hypothetical protein
MPVYEVFEPLLSDEKIGSFIGEIEGCIFHGTWKGNPLTKEDDGPWVIKKNGETIMEDCYLECVDKFDEEGQQIYGRGALI